MNRAGRPASGSARRAITATLVALALALVCIPMLGCAQRPAIEWQEYFDGLGEALSVHQTPDGGYLVGGSRWLLKTDANGGEEWRKDFEGGRARSIEGTADGGSIICGWTDSAGGLGRPEDAWLMKLDEYGEEEWQDNLGPGDARSVQQTADRGYIVALSGRPSLDDEGIPQPLDARLVKVDSAGNAQWDRAFTGPDEDSSLELSARQTADGGFVVLATWINNDALLTKIDSTGDEEWSQTYSNMRSSSPVMQTEDGGYVFLAWEVFPQTGEFVGRNWLIKTDSAGEMERLKLFNYEYGWSVQPTADRGYIVLARKKEIGSLLIKTDSRVMEDWGRPFRADEGERVQCAQQTSDGGYIVAAAACPVASQSNLDHCLTWLVKIAGIAPK